MPGYGMIKLATLPGLEGEYPVTIGPDACEISKITAAQPRIQKVKLMSGDFQVTEYVPFQESDVLDLPSMNLNGVSAMTLVLTLKKGEPLDVFALVGPAILGETRTKMTGSIVKTLQLVKGASSVTLTGLIGTFTDVVVLSTSVGVFIKDAKVSKTATYQMLTFDAPRVLFSESIDMHFECEETTELVLNVRSKEELVFPCPFYDCTYF